MGVDYVYDYLDDTLTDDDPYNYFEVGSGDYTGEENDWYLCINEPFENGIEGFVKKVDDFKNFLSKNNISYEGDVDCVGGLNIY